ncbi:GerAB/ArcD/ProY family transporter [Tissierella sp. Yu-01]|uniref:GerAB/ArcD/ProY family transporter n=1 Tax=Tissierella sp. Yu-01 TaxID=3035694 RepID=UPI00240D1B0C|nr:GerAB/ArcD/ProY family transporter [Tissierella sp. Yu-01]WFA09924.1 GerAB/ArcD/ProY family transporter [Tissierella sp. Yu-01]
MPTNKIPTRQIIGFLIVARLSFSISRMPALDIPPHNQNQWIMVLLSFVYVLIVYIPLVFLTNKFCNYSMVEYMKIIYGKLIGKVMGFLYGLYFAVGVVNSLTLQTELVTSSILPDSSNLVITVVVLITCAYISTRGVVTIFRGVDIIFPAVMITLLGLLLLGFNNIDFSIFLPIINDSSFLDINHGALILTLQFTDAFILLMVVSELEYKKDINKIFVISVAINVVLLIIAIIATQGTLGVEYSRHSVFPFLIYTRLIDFLRFIERIDLIFVVTWILVITTRITGFLYISTRVFRDVFNKDENEKFIIFIVSIFALIISMNIISSRPVVGIRKDFDLYLGILFVIFVLIIPIISCVVYLIRRKTIEDKEYM